MGGKIIVVPGLAVRRYAEEPAERLRQAGYDVDLRPALAWRGVPVDLAAYGEQLGAEIIAAGKPVDVLVGLSAGSQAAAVAAAATPLVRRLVLVSPTIDPDRRNTVKMLAIYPQAQPERGVRAVLRAAARLVQGRAAAHPARIPVRREAAAGGHPGAGGSRADHRARRLRPADDYAFKAQLAADFGGTLLVAPSGSHSWPTRDPEGFLRLIDELVA